ncbi:MAG: CPBP family intramembrane glutamic endopeptidase [Desulfobulbia bacterium]
MKQSEINSQVLIYASVMLVVIELLTVVVISQTGLQALLLIGLARITESGILLFIISRWGGGLESIGLTRNKVSDGLKKGLIWSAGFGVASVVTLGILYFLNFNLFKTFSSSSPSSISGLIPLLIVGGFFSPITEEIFFRGIVYSFLRKWGIILAILGSAILFSVVHAAITGVSFIQVTGSLVFAAAYEVEKNLVVPITIHVLGNMAIFALSFLMAL